MKKSKVNVYKKIIKSTLQKYLSSSEYVFFIFGSWATGSQKYFSDIDIGIQGKKKIPLGTIGSIKTDLEESDIPYTIDVVDMNRVSDKFRKNALQNTMSL